jgi:hypothetical protein
MPAFIESRLVAGRKWWFLWNETTTGENFVEKWNANPGRAEAFHTWHSRALSDLDGLSDLEGLDRLGKGLGEAFGRAPVAKALAALKDEITAARHGGRLSVVPGVGLSVGGGLGTSVRANTFFGAE